MSYIEFRKQFGVVIYIVLPVVIMIGALFFGANGTYYTIGSIVVGGVLFSLIESIFAKCPKCGRNAIPFLGEIPEQCPNCNKKFIS